MINITTLGLVYSVKLMANFNFIVAFSGILAKFKFRPSPELARGFFLGGGGGGRRRCILLQKKTNDNSSNIHIRCI